MKYVIVQGDGMADLPLAELDDRTPLEAAHTPHFDRLAGCGRLGLIHTIPQGYPPGSDVGNLSLFGYDPRLYYTGRSPLEAASMGVRLGAGDVSFRMNLVTVGEDGRGEIMEDYSGGHIDSEDAAEMVASLAEELADDTLQFYPGVSYRHLMVWRGGQTDMVTTPPHDLTGQPTAGRWPEGPGAEVLCRVMEGSRAVLAHHPVNRRRVAAGRRPVTQVWLWGQGRPPAMPSFEQRYHLRGACISAVDLVRGVAVYAGFDIVMVPGATGFLDTDYRAKGQYALKALEDHDIVFVHVEAPDEAGHMGDTRAKVSAIESIDGDVVGPLLERLPALGPHKLLVTSDHATPVSLRTHVGHPVPFALATDDQLRGERPAVKYGESEARRSGVVIPEGHTLISHLMAYPD